MVFFTGDDFLMNNGGNLAKLDYSNDSIAYIS